MQASAFKSKLAALETRAVGAESALERLQRDLGIASSDAQQQRDAANRLRDELQAAEGRYRAKVAELDDALVQGRNAKNYREELSRASEANETITLRLSQRDNEVVSLKRSFEEQSAQAREARETVAMLKTDLVRVTQERDGALERARHALSRAREVEEESHRDLAERDERLAATKSRLVAANERASEAEADRSRLLAALSHEGRHFATVLDAISEITNLVTSQRDSARELASLEARMGKLQSESQIEGDKAAAARRDLVHQLDLERSRIAEAEETVTRLVREKAAVTEKAETAVRARDRAHEELEQATHALAASEARCEEQARALRDAEAQLASLTESERSLRDQVRRLRERADAAGEVEETLNRTVISQRAELEQALVEINALAAELAEANEARSRSRTTITHLEERITEYSRTEEVSLRERDVTIEELRRFAEDLGLVFSASSLSSAAGASLTSALRGALGEFAGAAKARLAAKDRDLDACLSFMSALLRRLEEARARGLYATSASSASSAHAHGDEAVSVFASSSSSSSSSSATGITSFAGLKAGITEAANAIVTARDALNQDASELREHVAALEKRSAQLNAQLAATADSEARARAEIRTLSAELETATSTASDHHVAAEGYRGLVEVLARVLAPTHARLQELLVQKHYLVQELRAKDALAREILSLKARLAPPASSTAGGNERDGAASAPRPPRAVSMRGAAIAVLASRRLAALGRLPHHPANIFLSGSLTPVLPASAVASLSTSGLSLGGSVRDEVGSVRALLSSLASRFGPGGVDTVMPFRFLTPPARSYHHHHHHQQQQQLSGRQHYSGVGSGGYARFPPATRWALLTFSSLAADLNTVSVTYRSEITRLDNSVRKAESLLSRSQEINIALEERVHSLS
jgi:chromosome segregation ATPase